MVRPFARGCVVVRDGRFGVVWADRGGVLELLPVIQPDYVRAGDVLLDLADMIAMAVSIRDAVIRPTLFTASAARQIVVGHVPGMRICELVRAVIRADEDRMIRARWRADRAHCQRGRENAAV